MNKRDRVNEIGSVEFPYFSSVFRFKDCVFYKRRSTLDRPTVPKSVAKGHVGETGALQRGVLARRRWRPQAGFVAGAVTVDV